VGAEVPTTDTLRCVPDHLSLVPADDRVRSRALPALPYSFARRAAAIEGDRIPYSTHIERCAEAARDKPAAVEPAMPRMRPSDHPGVSLVRLVQMAGESLGRYDAGGA
jgi:hypothetical protein